MLKTKLNLSTTIGATRTRRTAALGLGLVVIMALTFAALSQLVPKAPNRWQSASTRAGWYLRSGQWHADVRTLAAALEFVMTPVTGTPDGTVPPARQLAAPSILVPNSAAIHGATGSSVRPPNS